MYITGPAHRSGGSRRVNCWPQIESRSRSLARNTEHFAHRARLGIAYASSAIEDRAPRARARIPPAWQCSRTLELLGGAETTDFMVHGAEITARWNLMRRNAKRCCNQSPSLPLSVFLSLSLSFSLSCILEPSRWKTRFPPFLDLVSTRCWKIRSLRERKKKRDPNPNAWFGTIDRRNFEITRENDGFGLDLDTNGRELFIARALV